MFGRDACFDADDEFNGRAIKYVILATANIFLTQNALA
jgi:hypothetical protein